MSGDPKTKPPPRRPSDVDPPRPGARTIRKEITNTPGAARFDSLLHSAYLDSLERLTGRPSVYTYGVPPVDAPVSTDPTQWVASAQYKYHAAHGRPRVMGADTLTVSPKLLENMPLGQAPRPANRQGAYGQPEFVLAHELGHRSRILQGMLRGEGNAHPVRAQQDSTYRATADSTVAGYDVPPYWTTNESEHQAEAFANGVQFLRATAQQGGDPDVAHRVAPLAAQYERAVPGTALMVSRLLQHPLYANHPIHRAMLPQRAAADATAVTPPRPPRTR